MAAAFGVLLLATLFQGSFGICFKKYQPFSWEAFWALFSIIGVLLMPHIWAFIGIGGDYFSYLAQTPAPMLIGGEVFGFENLPWFFLVCALAYLCNGSRSIYTAQRKLAQ